MAKHVTLSEADLVTLQEAARRTWEVIGYDILSATGGVDVSRSDVLEMVLDADRVTTYNPTLPETIHTFLATARYAAIKKAVLPAFPYTRYGY